MNFSCDNIDVKMYETSSSIYRDFYQHTGRSLVFYGLVMKIDREKGQVRLCAETMLHYQQGEICFSFTLWVEGDRFLGEDFKAPS